MAYGKKVVVKQELKDYIIGLIGPSGFGKSTLMFQVCDKLYGDDGYLAIDFGLEDGYSAINGAVVETCTNWDHFEEVVADIVANKEKEYPNLKVIICDTIDAAFECAESYCIRRYNREHLKEPNFKKAHSVNQIYGGFSGGYDTVIRTFKEAVLKLKSVGVGMFYTAHCKEKEFADMFTGATYTQLTASMTNRYFNAIKDISNVIGFGYYKRDVEHKDIGKINPINNQKKGRNEITSECRKIKFRDDSYLLDTKSKFAQITPEINLDVDEFINCINEAIKEASLGSKPLKVAVNNVINADFEEDQIPASINNVTVNNDESFPQIKDETEYTKEEIKAIVTKIRSEFSRADIETKKRVKAILTEQADGSLNEDLPIDLLQNIYDIVTA